MATPSPHAKALLDRLEGVVALDLVVQSTWEVLPDLRALRCAGDLDGFDPFAGQDLMVPVPRQGGGTRWRRYTVRAVDREAGTLDLWVTTDSDGPGAAWALAAASGDRFEAVGPRGKVRVDEDRRAHLFVVDTSGLSAAVVMAGSIPPPSVSAVVVLASQVPDAPALAAPGDAGRPTVAFFAHRDAVVEHLAQHLAPGSGAGAHTDDLDGIAAYVFGEFSFTRLARDRLVALGVPADRIATKPYWRAGQSNQDHGEPDKSPP